ncbi:MAG: HipA domain-containing protein [Ruminococcus sp.]|nr:HipA domain-containing protein [Ruminococcus sp.]
MKCSLMHRHLEVARLEIDETGFISKIIFVEVPEHLPVGVNVKNSIADRAALNEWWADRSIPASRSGLREALEVMGIESSLVLLTHCYGLSLSDQYWIKPSDSALRWEDINFFDNTFSEDMGDILFGKPIRRELDLVSPDNTSDGNLKKRWKIINGRRCLIKAGSAPFYQQPFNEVIASLICSRLNIPHIEYTITWIDGEPYSVCEDFVNSQTELIGAWRIYQTQKKDNNTSVYQHYVNCCKDLDIKDIEQSLDEMIVLDYIIANEDRHLNNFGMIRNAQTLEWICPAPIFDSGTSLGYDSLPRQILNGRNVKCKPFKRYHTEQLKLVNSFEWLDFARLDGIKSDIDNILSQSEEFIDEARKKAIVYSVMRRIDSLKAFTEKHTKTADSIDGDVIKNIEEKY